jgi:hypothetical protein
VADGYSSFVGGGDGNEACDTESAIAGGGGNAVSGGGDSVGFIGGGQSNTLTSDPKDAAILGGYNNGVSNEYSAIVGGSANSVATQESLIGGGSSNTIPSGSGNSLQSLAAFRTIFRENTASSARATPTRCRQSTACSSAV